MPTNVNMSTCIGRLCNPFGHQNNHSQHPLHTLPRSFSQPQQRFKGQPGEQWTMFFKDPSNNALEFKAMANPDFLFARYNVADASS